MNYSLSPNGQIISSIDVQAHLKAQLIPVFFFFTGKQYIKTSIKVSTKVQRIIGSLSRMSIWNVNQYGISIEILYFLRWMSSFIIFSCIFWLRSSFIFCLKKKYIIFSGEKIPSIQILEKDQTPLQFFWKDNILRIFEKSIIFPCIFLRKIIFLFPSKEWGHIFEKKEISSLLIIQERSYSRAIFETIFSEHLEK